jgi:hypothetical protein
MNVTSIETLEEMYRIIIDHWKIKYV